MSTSDYMTTPRSALRTINDGSDAIRSQKSLQARKPGGLGSEAPANKVFKAPGLQSIKSFDKENASSLMRIHVDPEPQHKVKYKEKVITRAPEPVPEKEILNIYDPSEDLKPKTDKALVGIVERLRNWRPPCMFGAGRPDSDLDDDDDDDVHYKQKSQPSPPAELDEVFDLSLVSLSDVLEDCDVPEPDIESDLNFPFVDDSIDIEPNLGTLEVWDASTPLSLSPRSERDPSSPRDKSDADTSCPQ